MADNINIAEQVGIVDFNKQMAIAIDQTKMFETAVDSLNKKLTKTGKATDEENAALKQNKKTTTEIAKVNKAYYTTKEKLRVSTSQNNKELVKSKQALSEQNRLIKLTAKLNKSAEGSYDKLSAQYSINKTKLNAMSEAQRKGTKEGLRLEKQTESLYTDMNRLQKATGKSQLQVGAYEKASAGLKKAFIGLTAVFYAGQAALRGLNSTINSTQISGDKFAVLTGTLTGAWEGFKKSIATGDLANLASNMKRAAEAGAEYARQLDDLGDRRRTLTIAEASARIEIEKQKIAADNVTLSTKERLKAAKFVQEEEKRLSNLRLSIANQLYDTESNNLEGLTELTKEETLEFIKSYDDKKEIRKDAAKFLEEETALLGELSSLQKKNANSNYYDKQIQELSSALFSLSGDAGKSVVAYSRVLAKYGKTTDAELDKVVAAYVETQEAQSNYFTKTRRAASQVNSLTKAFNAEKDAQKELVDWRDEDKISLDIIGKARVDVEKIIANQIDLTREEGETVLDYEQRKADAYIATGLAAKQAIEDAEATEQLEKNLQATEMYLQAAGALSDSYYQNKENQRETEYTNLENQLDQGLISEEEYTKKVALLDYQAAKDRHKQALLDITIATALNVVKAFPNVAEMIVAGGLGIAQGLVVAANPPAYPSFYKGTNNAPKGIAEVGEIGTEAIEKNGRVVFTPDHSSFVNLSGGEKILTAEQTNAKYGNNAGVESRLDKLLNKPVSSTNITKDFIYKVTNQGNITRRKRQRIG